MKKTLLFSIFILLAFASCTKNSSIAPANTISATIDGVNETFNTSVSAQIGTRIALNSELMVTGNNGSAGSSDFMAISISSNNTITTGNYTNSATNKISFPTISFSKAPFSIINPIFYTTDVNGAFVSTITITSMSNTNIQGTFSGKLVFTDGKTIKSVTNGKFNVDIK